MLMEREGFCWPAALHGIALERTGAMVGTYGGDGRQETQTKMRPLSIDCADANWKVLLKRNLQSGIEVDLENLDYNVDGVLCEVLAMAHSMTLRYNARTKSWVFKKQSAPFRVI